MSVVANAHWSHKWVTPMTGKRDQSEARSEEFRVMLEKLQNQASDKCYIYINNICLQIPCVTTGWAGFEGWKVEPEIPLWSPLGLGGVTLGEVVTAGFEPMASCCLASWGNFEQHLGQVGFRQANGWDTCWNKLEKKVRAKVVWTFKFFTDYCRYKKNLVLMLWRSRVFSMNLIKKWKPAVPVWMCIIK